MMREHEKGVGGFLKVLRSNCFKVPLGLQGKVLLRSCSKVPMGLTGGKCWVPKP